jgi:hypothetical protein
MASQDPGGDPNAKLYELRYDDGERFTLRHGGSTQREFDLASAISLADFEADRSGRLSVTDPETGAVLWVGTMATR